MHDFLDNIPLTPEQVTAEVERGKNLIRTGAPLEEPDLDELNKALNLPHNRKKPNTPPKATVVEPPVITKQHIEEATRLDEIRKINLKKITGRDDY